MVHETPVKQVGCGLQVDQEFDCSKLLALSTWNIQGKTISEAIVVLEDTLHDFNIIAFQEVSGCGGSLAKGAHCCMQDVGSNMSCLYAWPQDCFRPIAVAFEADSMWDKVHVGHSHMSVLLRVKESARPILVVCAHLPHVSRPLEDLSQAIDSILQDISPWMDKHYPIVLAGDLSYPLVADVGERSQMVHQMCLLLDLQTYSHNTCPSRSSGTRRLDHLVVNAAFQRLCLLQEVQPESALSCALESFHWDAQTALGCDHAIIGWEVLLSGSSSGKKRQGNSCRLNLKVGRKYVADAQAVVHGVAQYMKQCSSPHFDALRELQHISDATLKRYPKLSYQDPPDIKSLCMRRVMFTPGHPCL